MESLSLERLDLSRIIQITTLLLICEKIRENKIISLVLTLKMLLIALRKPLDAKQGSRQVLFRSCISFISILSLFKQQGLNAQDQSILAYADDIYVIDRNKSYFIPAFLN